MAYRLFGGQTITLRARFMGPTWGPSGADRTQAGPMLAPWTLLSRYLHQCWYVVILTPRSIFELKLMKVKNFNERSWIKISYVKWRPFCLRLNVLTQWGRLAHICVDDLIINGSDNGLAPTRRQAIIWVNVQILLIGPLGTKFSEILIEIYIFSFAKTRLKMSSG